MRYLLRVLIALFDMLVLWITGLAACLLLDAGDLLRSLSFSAGSGALLFPALVITLIFLAREGLYQLNSGGYRRQFFGVLRATFWIWLMLIAYGWLFIAQDLALAASITAWMLLLAATLPVTRILLFLLINQLGLVIEPTLVIGDQAGWSAFLEMAGEKRYLRTHQILDRLSAGELLNEAGNDFTPEANQRVDRLFAEAGLGKVIIFLEDLPRRRLTTLLRKFEIRARTIKLVPDAPSMVLMGSQIARHDSLPLLVLEQHLWSPTYRAIKRVIDLVVSLIALPFVLLLIALTAPFLGFRPLMRVKRLDLSGRPFTLPQLRVDYEKGGFLFQSGLYKVPELLNVLGGKQSLVGPAPLIERECELYAGLSSGFRVIRPGLTGLWQVSDYGYFDPGHRLGMDMYYAMNWSPAMEARILLESLAKGIWSLHKPRTGGMRT